MAHRINTSRQSISASQRNCNYRPNNNIAQHVLASTITGQGFTGQIGTCKAGRSFTIGSLSVSKGDKIVLVASTKFPSRYYVCSGGQWSTNDQAVIAKCQQAVAA